MTTSAKLKKPDEQGRAIIGLYLLFARLLNEELNPDLRNLLLQPEVLEVVAKAEPEVADYLASEWSEKDYEAAAVDFCDTFILPKMSIQPRAIAWLHEGSEVSSDGIHAVVQAFLDRGSTALPDELSKLPLDHASVLFFMAASLRETGSDQSAEFEHAVLGSWIHDFGGALRGSRSPLYRALGKLIEAS